MEKTKVRIDLERQKDLQRLKAFRLMDDDFMNKFFDGDPVYIQLVLRIILGKADLVVIDVRTQVFIQNLLNRSVRLDVVATDSQGRMYDIEIQRADDGAVPQRGRYLSSMMDVHQISQKGMAFKDLPEAWVIFITENDIYGKGRSLYRVERYIKADGIKYNDGSHIIYP